MGKSKNLKKFETQTISGLFRSPNEIRKEAGLPPIKPGVITCLSCGKKFNSWDTTMNRRCDTCKSNDSIEEVRMADLEGDDLLDSTLLDSEEDE